MEDVQTCLKGAITAPHTFGPWKTNFIK